MLQKVWAASGGQCGRYLAASMALQLDALERHGELVDGRDRYGPAVRAELLAMSSATIDRYLRGAKARDQISVCRRRNPPRCCGPRSPSAKQAMRPKNLGVLRRRHRGALRPDTER
ncbi:hypothetical protein MSHO_13650 [Mycobacterium shottsii]|uniref:Uncharacterized protein n=2 Tax=Mycobacterium shottsii TaxID=133549 RepID=A0A7I7L8N5_9MYCO|nr:hypothetical protein MSHO_13650 [Mycobacterium shottsii]